MEKYSEYYFDYKIRRIFGSVAEPKIYFERDYKTKDLPYTMYLIPEEWLGRSEEEWSITKSSNKEEVKQAKERLPYDFIHICFDTTGIECAPLSDQESKEYKNAERKIGKSFEDFYKENCRVVIDNAHMQDHSGVGVIEFLKADGDKKIAVAKFFFAVNFIFRKKISYSLKAENNNKLEVVFTCEDRPKGIKASLIVNENKYPCLKEEIASYKRASFELDFSGREPVCKKIFDVNPKKFYFSVSLEPPFDKYYLLDCVYNMSLNRRQNMMLDRSKLGHFCPYCHKPILESVENSEQYKKGCVVCSFSGTKKDIASLNIKSKRGIFCQEDLTNDQMNLKPDRMRLLPDEYMKHDNIKIAFVGSTRAGKTTYVSRFFDIHGEQIPVTANLEMVQNSMNIIGVGVKSAMIREVAVTHSGLETGEKKWNEHVPYYAERAININGSLPAPTTTGDYTAYPFIAEIDGVKSVYASFYDIAGEDAEHSIRLEKMSPNQQPMGIFCFINGNRDDGGNSGVIGMLNSSNLSKDCPIAVIVTKMDTLEDKFDSNCQCLRMDYLKPLGKVGYGESELSRIIDYSSEEIKSYLQSAGLLPNLEKYTNVKYFGVSSFAEGRSIHKDGQGLNTVGKLSFSCSPKRLELPFIWMIRQFDVII